MALRMLHDYVLVRADEAQEETAGGIVLAPSSVEAPATGKVVSVGPGKFDRNGNRIEHGIEDGDSIIFGKSALRDPIKHEGEDLYVMTADAIFGVDR